METKTIGFISLGLIGGSIAKTMRRIFPDYRIMAYNRSPEVLAEAIADGAIHTACDCVDERFAVCDYIFLCAPVEVNVSFLPEIRKWIRPGTVLTDVGSTKSDIAAHIAQAGLADFFIGGHPMAGSEKTGYHNATAYLLENAYYILTPSETVAQAQVDDYYKMVQALGALPMVLDCTTHDFATAAVSHVPHLIAASLVNLVKDSDNEDALLKTIAAGGFKDITRIASSSPDMWEQICTTNSTQIRQVLHKYIESLQDISRSLEQGRGSDIHALFDTAGEYRNSMSIGPSGAIRRVYEIYCDIIDESGAIATIATILATNGISIKNIGIVHNREFQEGVLHIAFYDEPAQKNAVELLKRHSYTVYVR